MKRETVSFGPLSIILISPVISSESGDKYAQIEHWLQAKTVQNHSREVFQCIVM